MLKVEDAYFAISGTPIIEGVSFEIKKGEIACLLGPSGSGKTSILRLIAGLEALDRGNIFIGDQLVSNKQHNLSPNKRGIGFLFQDYALFPHLTVYQNIAWGIGKTEKDKTEVIVKQLLDRIQMYGQAEKYPHELSGGEQQRVALARAQACQPNLLLLDEPFSGLDTNLRNDIREQTNLILRSDKVTSIIVTHDPEEAMTLADKIILINNGKISQVGNPEELYRSPSNKFAASFFGDINRLNGIVEGKLIKTSFGCFANNKFPEGVSVDVLARPESLKITRAPKDVGITCNEVEIQSLRKNGKYTVVRVGPKGDKNPENTVVIRQLGEIETYSTEPLFLELTENNTFLFAKP